MRGKRIQETEHGEIMVLKAQMAEGGEQGVRGLEDKRAEGTGNGVTLKELGNILSGW